MTIGLALTQNPCEPAAGSITHRSGTSGTGRPIMTLLYRVPDHRASSRSCPAELNASGTSPLAQPRSAPRPASVAPRRARTTPRRPPRACAAARRTPAAPADAAALQAVMAARIMIPTGFGSVGSLAAFAPVTLSQQVRQREQTHSPCCRRARATPALSTASRKRSAPPSVASAGACPTRSDALQPRHDRDHSAAGARLVGAGPGG
jgi:hypothetical protein